MSEEKQRPKVGVGVAVIKDKQVLVGKRLNAHGDGTWCFPSGHLEFNEQFSDCAIREVEEESGIKIKNVRFLHLTNDFNSPDETHYITIFMVADYHDGEPKILEPDKMIEWRWVKWHELPAPRFTPIENLLKDGINPFQ